MLDRLNPDIVTVEDSDLGVIKQTSLSSVTPVTITYSPQLFLEYEPFFTKSEIVAVDADTNPLQSGTSKGFVQVTTEILDPFEIELTAEPSNSYIFH